MRGINLLPWREEIREERKREYFIYLGGAAVIAVLLVILMHTYMANRINSQQTVNATLVREIAVLDKQIEEIKILKDQRQKLIEHIRLIQELQANRPLIVNIFNSFGTIIPDGVYIKNIKRIGSKISVSGEAESNTRISLLMRNIENSEWLKNPSLTEIKDDNSEEHYTKEFILDFEQKGDTNVEAWDKLS